MRPSPTRWMLTGPGGSRRIVRGAAFLAALFVAGILVAPWLDAAGLPAGSLLHRAYGPLCHQLPSRSLEIHGRPWAVCARCAGLYVGGASALVLAALRGRSRGFVTHRAWFFAALAPTLLDVAAGVIVGIGTPNAPRFALALPAGFVAGLFLAEGLADLGGRRWTTAPRTCSDPR